MKLTQEMIDEIQRLMEHTKKDGSMNWVDGEELQINLAGTFAADRFIVIKNVSKKPWEPSINSSQGFLDTFFITINRSAANVPARLICNSSPSTQFNDPSFLVWFINSWISSIISCVSFISILE